MLKNRLAPTEQKSYADFQSPGGVPLVNVPPEQKDVQDFTGLARQNDVNVSVKHKPDTGTYYLCLQGQTKNIEQAAAEYKKRMRVNTQSRGSVSVRLEQARLQAASRSKEAGKNHEREHIVREK